jgi:hypothetical protein
VKPAGGSRGQVAGRTSRGHAAYRGDLTWPARGATSWRPPPLLCGHRQSHECPALRAVVQQARGCVLTRWFSSQHLLRRRPELPVSMITAAVSKEVAVTRTVKELLEQHREQEVARLQAALLTAQQAAQTAQQAAQQAAAQTAEHKAEIHQLKEEVAAVKAKMAAMKQAGAPRPGEPHPPPKWQPDTELPLSRQDKLLSSLVQELRGGVVEGKAAQSELVGRLGLVAGKLDQITAKLSSAFSSSTAGSGLDPLGQQITEHRPGEPAGEVTGLLCWRRGG